MRFGLSREVGLRFIGMKYGKPFSTGFYHRLVRGALERRGQDMEDWKEGGGGRGVALLS